MSETSNTPKEPIYYIGLRIVPKEEYLAALMKWSTHFGTVQP